MESAGLTLPKPPSDGANDSEKLSWMLETIRAVLSHLVFNDDPTFLDFHMRSRFQDRWPEVTKAIQDSIDSIKKAKPDSELFKMLGQAGMTEEMLSLKTASLAACVDGLYREVKTGSPILGMKWLKPTTKCMNTILFSLIRALPGVEVVKEYKDHLEVGLDVAEAKLAK